jgi:glutathione S-transferase
MKQQVRFVTNKMCPYAQKAYIALECAQIPYRVEEIALYGGKNSKPDWFWELNPAGTLPVLVVEEATAEDEQENNTDDSSPVTSKSKQRRRPTTGNRGRVFPDSDLILDEIGSGRLMKERMGKDIALQVTPEQTSQVENWRTFINQKILPIGKKAVLGGPKQPLWDVLGEMNDQIIHGPFLVEGSSFPTIADCHAFPFLWRLDQEYDLSRDFPNISLWLKACQDQPGFRKTIQKSWWWWW